MLLHISLSHSRLLFIGQTFKVIVASVRLQCTKGLNNSWQSIVSFMHYFRNINFVPFFYNVQPLETAVGFWQNVPKEQVYFDRSPLQQVSKWCPPIHHWQSKSKPYYIKYYHSSHEFGEKWTGKSENLLPYCVMKRLFLSLVTIWYFWID